MTMTTSFETTDGIVLRLPVEKIAKVTIYTDNHMRLAVQIRMDSGLTFDYQSGAPEDVFGFARSVLQQMEVLKE